MLAKKFKLSIYKSLRNKKALKILKGKYFNFKIFENGLDYSRFGVIINSKIFKKSFLRNKLKRLIFEDIKLNKFYFKSSRDCLIIVRPEIAKIFLTKDFNKKEIKEDLEVNLGNF